MKFTIRPLPVFTAIALSVFLYSCTIDLPDLNPATEEGPGIEILDISGPVIYFNGVEQYNDLQFPGFYEEYDIGGDGTVDMYVRHDPAAEILFRILNLDVQVAHHSSELLPAAGHYTPLYLTAGALTGSSTINGLWDQGVFLIMVEENVGPLGYDPPYFMSPILPVGLSYVPIRVKTGGQYFYGWLEFFITDYNDNDPEDFLIISRMGLAQTPGLRIRMGQE